jgi:glyoxalase family protein
MTGRGLHHVTLVSSDVARSCRFYGHLLGMRLVKRTVSHEDPGTYHLCFGNAAGHPGTLFTLFPWERAARGKRGSCGAWRTSLLIPKGSSDWWKKRLMLAGLDVRQEQDAFGQTSLVFEDEDDALLALLESSNAAAPAGWHHPEIPAEHAIQGLGDLVLKVRNADSIENLFREVLGFEETGREGGMVQLKAHDGPGGTITLDETGPIPMGRLGAGCIHHAAFRARDNVDEDAMAAELLRHYAIVATMPKDRTYFRSVNFRSDCGLLMEIATDGPGFEVDELFTALGTNLALPAFLEPRRPELQRSLPAIPELT